MAVGLLLIDRLSLGYYLANKIQAYLELVCSELQGFVGLLDKVNNISG